MHTQVSFGVVAVRYAGTYIEHIKTVEKTPAGAERFARISREAMVAAMHDGAVFTTKGKSGDHWNDWGTAALHVCSGVEYIKLRDDGQGMDDLGDLPGY